MEKPINFMFRRSCTSASGAVRFADTFGGRRRSSAPARRDVVSTVRCKLFVRRHSTIFQYESFRTIFPSRNS